MVSTSVRHVGVSSRSGLATLYRSLSSIALYLMTNVDVTVSITINRQKYIIAFIAHGSVRLPGIHS